jgi:hypothetical protein
LYFYDNRVFYVVAEATMEIDNMMNAVKMIAHQNAQKVGVD